MKKNRRIYRKKKVRDKTGLSDSTIYRKEKDGKFPKRIKISERLVGWYEDEIERWLNDPMGYKCTKSS